MQDEQNDEENDPSETNRQPEAASIPTEQSEKTALPKSKKEKPKFTGIAAFQALKQKIFDIIDGGK